MNKVSSRTRDSLGRALDSAPVYVIAALVIVVLLVSFYVVLLVNMNTIDAKTEDLKEHPYAVTVAAGRAETLLMQIRTLDDRLAFTRSEETLESVQLEFSAIDDELQTALHIIESRHRSESGKAKALLEAYSVFREEQARLVELAMSTATDESVAVFLAYNINPRIDAMLVNNSEVIAAASQSFDQLYAAASETRADAITTSTVLMVAVAIALILFFVAIGRKNRQQEQLQESLRRAVDKAQDASRAKSRFLSNVSHDIRTPLTAIIGLTDIAVEHIGDRERVAQSLEKVQLSSHHLLNLVNDVLDMSKIESGQIDLNCEPIDLRSVVDTLASIVHPQAETKQLAFSVTSIGVEDGLVMGDEMRVSQVLINLLGNAVKYTEPGGTVNFIVEEVPCDACPPISVSPCASTSASGGGRIRIIRFVVEDDGIGMSQDFMSRVFDPFEREDVPARSMVEGTGLGMAIAKNLADLMGGAIDVQSQRNRGSRFTLTLPFEACGPDARVPEPPRVAATTSAAPSAAPSAPERPVPMPCEAKRDDPSDDAPDRTWSQVRVLLAEDNEIVGEIAEEFIRETGAALDRAWNGLEALELLQSHPEGHYDLVFMDIQMPCMDGLEAARAMVAWCECEGRRRPPIIAMTANAYVEDRQRALDAGMDGFAVKPISEREIRHLLHSYVHVGGDK